MNLDEEFPGWQDWPIRGQETEAELRKMLASERMLNHKLAMALEGIPVVMLHYTRYGSRWWTTVGSPVLKEAYKHNIRAYVCQETFAHRREEVLESSWARRNIGTLTDLLLEDE